MLNFLAKILLTKSSKLVKISNNYIIFIYFQISVFSMNIN